jgi:hypothetical protein
MLHRLIYKKGNVLKCTLLFWCNLKTMRRIHTIFSLWLSHYWNDFSSTHVRKQIILFIDYISRYEHYTPICDSLAPLIIREPPLHDPDESWGLSDDLNKRNEKKDSGYSSFIYQQDIKVVTHSESQPNLRSSKLQLPRRTEFAGGLINIDNAIKRHHSTTPSIATSSAGRWAASFGHHATSFISSFRHTQADKDQFSYNYKVLTKTFDKTLADQLTWIESELFSQIQVK